MWVIPVAPHHVGNPRCSAYEKYFPQITHDWLSRMTDYHAWMIITQQKQNSISLFRLRTGHCKLNSHRFTLGLHPTVLWKHCHVQEIVSHYLTHSPVFQPQRLKLQQAMNRIGITYRVHWTKLCKSSSLT